MANPCKYTLKDGKVLDFTQARQYVMDNIEQLTKESPTLKKEYDAATKGKVEEGDKPERKDGDEGGEAPKTSRGNRAKKSKAVSQEIDTPETRAIFNMIGDAFKEQVDEVVSTRAAEEVKSEPMTAAEKGKSLAEKIRAAKLKNRGETYSSLPFLPQAVDAALEAAALIAENGGKLIDVINAAIDALRSHPDYKTLNNEQKASVEKDLKAELVMASDEVEQTQTGSGKFKVSKTAKDLIEGLRKAGKNSLAEIIEAGKNYEVRNQKDVWEKAVNLHRDSPREVYQLAKNKELHPDITNAIFAQRLIDAQAAFSEDQNTYTKEAYEQAFRDYKQYGTTVAQGMAMRGFLANLIPNMIVNSALGKLDNDVKNALGIDGNDKINEVAVQAKQIRIDVFSAIAKLMAGESVPLASVSNPKVRKALDVLVSFGANLKKDGSDKSGLAQLLELVKENGKLAVSATREQVREMVSSNLKDINGRLKNPMTESQVEKATDAFMEVYEEAASKQMEKAIAAAYGERDASISKNKNPAIAKLILYGGLEGQAYQNKFATKYNLPTLTPANVAQLTQLAQNIANAKGTFAFTNASNAFNSYLNSLRNNSKNIVNRAIGNFSKYVAAFQYNNVLFRPLLLAKAFISNVLQTAPKIVRQAIRERQLNPGGVFNERRTSIVDPVTKKIIPIVLSPTKDFITFGIKGMSKEGRSDIEREIINQEKRGVRILGKTFLVASSRSYAATDAFTIPIATAITQRQAYGALLRDEYKKRKIKPTRKQISDDLNALLGRDDASIQAAFAKAVDEIRNSKLWTDLGFTAADDFPSNPGIKGLTSKESRIYNETKIRMYEILSEDVLGRLAQMKESYSPNMGYTAAEIWAQENINEINRFVSANTREISFLGRPQGTPGEMADKLLALTKGLEALKHATFLPLFAYAPFNGLSLYIKYDPFLATLRSAKYKMLGTRGLGKKERESGYKMPYLVKEDQQRLLESTAAAWGLAIAIPALVSAIRGDDDEPEERKKKAAEGRFTGIATKEMEGRGLKDASGKNFIEGGYVYVDGVKQFNWMMSPFYGSFAAAAFWDNKDVFETLPAYATEGVRRPFVEDSPEFTAALGMYVLNTMSGVMNYSGMSQQYKMLSNVMELSHQSNKTASEKAGDVVINQFANMIQSFVPLSGLQKDAQNAYDAYNGNPSKMATDFYEKVAINLAFVDGALRSEKTDCFGRPIDEQLKAVDPLTMGYDVIQFVDGRVSLPFNRIYKGDPYMQMHTMHNYYPRIGNSDMVPQVISVESDWEFEGELATRSRNKKKAYTSVEDKDVLNMLNLLSEKENVENVETSETHAGHKEYITYDLELTAEETHKTNAIMGSLVKEVFDYVDESGVKNMDNMMGFQNNEQYKSCMGSLYSICKMVAIAKEIPEIQSQRQYISSALKMANSWDKEYTLLSFPDNIREDLIKMLDKIDEAEDK
jgi:hypothetical protein